VLGIVFDFGARKQKKKKRKKKYNNPDVGSKFELCSVKAAAGGVGGEKGGLKPNRLCTS
jgi:hypothetical protein